MSAMALMAAMRPCMERVEEVAEPRQYLEAGAEMAGLLTSASLRGDP